MKILHITTHLNKGGITSYLYSLASGLEKRGHKVIVASCGGESKEDFLKGFIQHIDIPINTKKEISPSILFSYFILAKILSKGPVDIVHAHTRVTQVLGVLLSRRFKIPLVTTCHGFFKPRWHRRVFPCWGSKVIAISSQVRDHLIRDFKVSHKNIYLIHNGIDLGKFSAYSQGEIEALKKDMGLPLDYIVIGTAARFSTVKGLEYLIKAFSFVLKENAKAVLLLIGYGQEEQNLKKIAQQLKVQDKVVFYRPVRDSYEYMPAIDIFVMPSIQEGLGLSILEAQAYKIPVIASRIGGIPDIIEDGITGVLVKPRDELAIGEAILRLIRDKNLCADIKQRAYKKLTQDFSLEKMVLETENIYKELRHEFYKD